MSTLQQVALVSLFTLTVFTGSSLLFVVQPMFAKLVLPHLGGSPSVWNTCMLFFQAVLLLGYLYAHVSTKALPVRTQAIVHLLLLGAPFAILPISVAPTEASTVAFPTSWLLITAIVAVGLPFFVVSTSAPLLQRWFAVLPHPSADDPYFLYAASNLGSMVALLSYPFAVEPLLGLTTQAKLWSWGYGFFVLLTAACALGVRTFGVRDPHAAQTDPVASAPLRAQDRLWWLLMAFVPSTLMLGVTNHISTDIAAVPLLWVAPLAIYLLTFVVAFGGSWKLTGERLANPVSLLAFATLVSVLLNAHQIWFIPIHLIAFASAALLCHVRLAASRPAVSHLTEFYIWISLGGVLGGALNSVIAPAVFSTVFEYPLALAVVILIAASSRKLGPIAPGSLKAGLACAATLMAVISAALPPASLLNQVTVIGATAIAGLAILEQRNLGLAIRAVVLIGLLGVVSIGRSRLGGVLLHTERSFFGVHRIVEAHDGSHRKLYHGSTIHGWQSLPATGCEPSSYFSRKGPIGDLFATAAGRLERVAVIGLGTGALACYAGARHPWTFYEIDPVVERLATNAAYFSQLSNSAGKVSIVVADGRIGLHRAAPGSYDLLILDAFSSDSIPVHLLTLEAFQLYFSRLTARGIIAVHISNRYLQLEPALAAVAGELGLHGYVRSEGVLSPDDIRQGRTASHWVVLARRPEHVLGLEQVRDWRALEPRAGARVWTDDYSNVLEALILKYRRP